MPAGRLGRHRRRGLLGRARRPHRLPLQPVPHRFRGRSSDYEFDDDDLVSACVYSSETGTWGSVASIPSPSRVGPEASTLAGNSLYWQLDLYGEYTNYILELRSQRLALIELPEAVGEDYMFNNYIMPAGNGSIGFACVSESSVHFWSRSTGHREGAGGWVLLRMMDLRKLNIHQPGLAAGWHVVVDCSEVC